MTTPVTTKTDLLLLGLLLDRPMHGYELYQQIQSEGIDQWFSISAAGVYYSLGKLHDQASVAESRQQGGRSSRKSVYRLTDKGRKSFFEAMEVELASQEETCLEYDLVIYLLNKLPSHRAIPQLEQRQVFLAEQVETVEMSLRAERENGRSPLKLAILDHKRRFLEMERDWLAGVIQSVCEEDGAGYAAEGTGRGLMSLSGELRHYHMPDLIRLIVSGHHSGTLTLTEGSDIYTLTFKEGQPACIGYQRRREPPQAPNSTAEAIDGLCDLFHRQEGRFAFDQRLDCEDWHMPLDLDAEELILRGCRRVDNWGIIERLIPSADVIFELARGSLDLEHLPLSQTEARIVEAVDGVKDVASIARELDLTLFETSRSFYCLTAIGVLHPADPDKIRLRRGFREIAELVCESTIAWRSSPDDRSCEEEVNERCQHLPIRLVEGRVEDRADPQLSVDELSEMYRFFLQQQFRVVSRRFGRANARQAFERTLRHLPPELQDVARRYGFDRVSAD